MNSVQIMKYAIVFLLYFALLNKLCATDLQNDKKESRNIHNINKKFSTGQHTMSIPNTPLVNCIEVNQEISSPNTIYKDDFEDFTPISQKYFDYNSSNGAFVVVDSLGLGGSFRSMRSSWTQGLVSAGSIMYMFGRNPVGSQSHSNQNFQDIYWRFYIQTSEGWVGNPYKLSRTTVFAAPSWAQAMIAHVWGEAGDLLLELDPATGINSSGILVTTKYNDFANLRWLGLRKGVTPIYETSLSNSWYCIEVHVKLNTSGLSDGIFEFWIDGNLEARRTDLNWVGTWQDYGINAVMFSNYWNGGAPRTQERYLDNIVISQNRIGFAPSPINPYLYKTPFQDADSLDYQSEYEAQVSESTNFGGMVWYGFVIGESNVIKVDQTNGTFHGPLSGMNSLENNKIYYARVRQRDNNGNISEWSQWKIFSTGSITVTQAPGIPTGLLTAP